MVFRRLRALFTVDAGEYMLSICSETALRELSSPGKSGALFYISHDDRFLIKTMRRSEMKTFLAMLPRYFEHAQGNPHMLITKFYGLYRIKLKGKGSKQSRKARSGTVRCCGFGERIFVDCASVLRRPCQGADWRARCALHERPP